MNSMSFQFGSWTRPVALAAALIGLTAAVPANAGEKAKSNQVPQVVVSYADLNIDRDDGALVLYRRIAAAARTVCPDYGTRNLGTQQVVRACRDESMARAISQVGSVRLAAIYAARQRVG